MLKDIMKLALDLIAIESTDSNPEKLKKALEVATRPLNSFQIKNFASNGYKSVLVYNTERMPKEFGIILNGHVDVIPGPANMYKGLENEGRLYGNGSMDMKAAVACLVYVFKNIAKEINYPIGLQLVTDEQQGSLDGTAYQIKQGVKTKFALMAETTNLDIVNRAKGVIWVKLIVEGSSAHSAYPWKAENAVLKMNKVLNNLVRTFPNPKNDEWVDTINVSSVQTENTSFNKIPDKCFALVDFRYIGDKASKLKKLRKFATENRTTLEIVHEESKLEVPEKEQHLKLLKEIVEQVNKKPVEFYGAHGTSDATYYSDLGVPAIEFGPVGSKGTVGGENVSIESLEKYCEILISFLRRI